VPDVFTPEYLDAQLQTLNPAELAFVNAEASWIAKARRKQVIPLKLGLWTDPQGQLRQSGRGLLMTGRGWGKTEVAANWCRRCAGLMPGSIGHVVAPTHGDLVGTVFEGISGLLKAIPQTMIEHLTYSPYPLLTLKNQTIIRGFSAEKPDRLRGPQCHWLWGDETATWQYYDAMMANIDFSTRLVYVAENGERIQPQRLFTTTPRPLEQIRELAEDPKVYQVRGSTHENKDNLAETFFDDIEKHEGTKLGDQEIHGLILDFDESAIIKKRWIRMWPKARELPQFGFIYLSFDTALTEETYDEKTNQADFTACTAWGVFMFEGRMNVMMLTAWREHLGMPELIEKAREEMRMEYGYIEPPKFKTYVGQGPALVRAPRKPKLMIIEDKGSGTSLRQMLSKENVPMHPYNPGRASKMERLNSVAHVVKGGKDNKGRLWIPESQESTPEKLKFVSWADQFLGEFCIYNGPGSTKHDDYVDSGSQALRYFADNYLGGEVAKKDPKRVPKAPVRVGNPYGG
jgi:phage terminase large subunit-like protein